MIPKWNDEGLAKEIERAKRAEDEIIPNHIVMSEVTKKLQNEMMKEMWSNLGVADFDDETYTSSSIEHIARPLTLDELNKMKAEMNMDGSYMPILKISDEINQPIWHGTTTPPGHIAPSIVDHHKMISDSIWGYSTINPNPYQGLVEMFLGGEIKDELGNVIGKIDGISIINGKPQITMKQEPKIKPRVIKED